jgi:hypothetical protein
MYFYYGEVHLKESDDKDRSIDGNNTTFKEVLHPIIDYIITHDQLEQVEEENIEVLHCRMVVMSSPRVNSLPFE